MKRVIGTAAAGFALMFGVVGCGGNSAPAVTTVTTVTVSSTPTTSTSASPTTGIDDGEIKWTPLPPPATVAPVRWKIAPPTPLWQTALLWISVIGGMFLMGSLIGKWISRTSENAEHAVYQGYSEWAAQHQHDSGDDD